MFTSSFVIPLILAQFMRTCARQVKIQKSGNLEHETNVEGCTSFEARRLKILTVECHFAKESYNSINATLAAIAKIVSEDKRKSLGK